MENRVVKLIEKYKKTILILKENRDNKTVGDNYDYEMDIKICLGVVKDLESLIFKKKSDGGQKIR